MGDINEAAEPYLKEFVRILKYSLKCKIFDKIRISKLYTINNLCYETQINLLRIKHYFRLHILE